MQTNDPPPLTLFFAPGSSSMAPHIALHEAGLPFTACRLSFAQREQRSAAFLAINPQGKVPVLMVGAQPITEVAATLYCIAKLAPAARLWPEHDLLAQAEILSWMSFAASTLHPARRQGVEQVKTVYAVAERRLAKRPWAVDDYSIADIHLFRLYWRMRSSLQPATDEFPALEAHHARMLERAAVRRTIELEAAAGYELPS